MLSSRCASWPRAVLGIAGKRRQRDTKATVSHADKLIRPPHRSISQIPPGAEMSAGMFRNPFQKSPGLDVAMNIIFTGKTNSSRGNLDTEKVKEGAKIAVNFITSTIRDYGISQESTEEKQSKLLEALTGRVHEACLKDLRMRLPKSVNFDEDEKFHILGVNYEDMFFSWVAKVDQPGPSQAIVHVGILSLCECHQMIEELKENARRQEEFSKELAAQQLLKGDMNILQSTKEFSESLNPLRPINGDLILVSNCELHGTNIGTEEEEWEVGAIGIREDSAIIYSII